MIDHGRNVKGVTNRKFFCQRVFLNKRVNFRDQAKIFSKTAHTRMARKITYFVPTDFNLYFRNRRTNTGQKNHKFQPS